MINLFKKIKSQRREYTKALFIIIVLYIYILLNFNRMHVYESKK